MFLTFFQRLRSAGVPVSLTEYLALLRSLAEGVVSGSVDDFYFLSRACLVKDERHLDKFDRVFGQCFQGAEAGLEDLLRELPEDWLRSLAARVFSPEEMAQIRAVGDWDKLMDLLRERLLSQKERHEGGSKWIGTKGSSPFGADGYNPEGVRIGQKESRHRRAVKVWDRREFRNLDDNIDIGTRNIQLALRRLRKLARDGAREELDLPATIRHTARNGGCLDLCMVPERHNAVKVLLLLDIGGSMDDHVRSCAELFSAARSEFKHLRPYYFHNCLYETVWQDNQRRHAERLPVGELLRTYPSDYKLIFVGDAAMSPYEIVHAGGSVEHHNGEAGQVWVARALAAYPRAVWLNPMPEEHWPHYQSVAMMHQLMGGRMYPLTLAGLDRAMKELRR